LNMLSQTFQKVTAHIFQHLDKQSSPTLENQKCSGFLEKLFFKLPPCSPFHDHVPLSYAMFQGQWIYLPGKKYVLRLGFQKSLSSSKLDTQSQFHKPS
jgi:hypothetical protein